MKSAIILFSVCWTIFACESSKTIEKKETTLEIQKFMDDYAVMLRDNIQNVGNLYSDSGVVISGFGSNRFLPLDSIKLDYQRRVNMEDFLGWRNIRIDLLKKDLVLVTSIFYIRNADSIDSTRFAYTGLLVRTTKGWRIIHEHESRRPRNR